MTPIAEVFNIFVTELIENAKVYIVRQESEADVPKDPFLSSILHMKGKDDSVTSNITANTSSNSGSDTSLKLLFLIHIGWKKMQ